MTILIKVNNKKISKKKAIEQFGAARIEARINEAIEAYYDDPLELCTWMDGMEIIISQN
jgi:hypothetical protein